MPQETVATRAAFRAGVKGLRYTENPDPGFDIPVATDTVPGPNERHFETVERLPGLSDPEAAYEAGRALRMIGHIPDSQSSPVEHGRHFLSELGNAVLFFALRGERQPLPRAPLSSPKWMRRSVNATVVHTTRPAKGDRTPLTVYSMQDGVCWNARAGLFVLRRREIDDDKVSQSGIAGSARRSAQAAGNTYIANAPNSLRHPTDGRLGVRSTK